MNSDIDTNVISGGNKISRKKKMMIEGNVTKKEVILIFLVTFLILLLLAVMFYYNIDKDDAKEMTATVKYFAKDYLIVIDNEDNCEYLLSDNDNDNEYNIGDILHVRVDNIDEDAEPKTADLISAYVVSSNNDLKVVEEDKKYEDASSDNSLDSNDILVDTTSQDNNTTSDNSNASTDNKKDDIIVSYFNDLNKEVSNSSSITDKIKTNFVKMVDFIFYGGMINGYTFKDISTSAKMKVLSIALDIDSKIESKFPDYKNNLETKYKSIQAKIVAEYLTSAEEVCKMDSDACSKVKENLAILKDKFSLSWDFVKDISLSSASRLRSWYEIWSES